MPGRKLFAAATALLLATSAHSATIFDDAIESDTAPSGSEGTISTIGTSGAAVQDYRTVDSVTGRGITADIQPTRSLSDVTVDVLGYGPGAMNRSGAFRLIPGNAPTLSGGGATLGSGVSGPALNLFGVISAGSDFFSVTKAGNALPAKHTASIDPGGLSGPLQAVPVPVAMALLAAALAVLGKVSLRKR